MASRVNPTRMELLRSKKRSTLAKKGHKLLKDKRDGLMQEFMKIVREARQLRDQVDAKLAEAMQHFVLAQSTMLPEAVALVRRLKPYGIELSVAEKNVMGVRIPEFDITLTETDEKYSNWETSVELDAAMKLFRDLLPLLLKLASIEKAAELLAQEIERTRRRVNALEYVLIPQLKDTIKYIRMKLDEQERSAIITSMALKEKLD
ncbi:MAG: V-type ATP synthase subunit D [Candidatus Andersenbacteria bacterium]|nr:V-type ATP synthase subunit D [Candidatus Andersenbacteria bacterium]MBI3250413.1 V-type ATP synthase subunit D [Candidatus Andersenbacteria bacterium]